MRHRRHEAGFTLVELMVVVLIIGILVAIAIPVFNEATYTARQKTCFANQRTLEGAAQQWVGAGTPASPRRITDVDSIAVLVTGGYIQDVPSCPSGGIYSMTDGIVAACTAPADDPHGRY